MPMLLPIKVDLMAGLILDVLASPVGQYDAVFDSYLLRKEGGGENHTLTLVLKLHLNQVSTPMGLSMFPYKDAGGTFYWITPWQPGEWQLFKQTFKQQCQKWSNRFWLIPPAGYTNFDVPCAGRTIRPNIYCHLYIDLVTTPAGAHRTIDVVNLHKPSVAAQNGVPVANLNSSDFGSHESLYDSLDTVPRTNNSQDNTATNRQHVNYLTIVHEVGHALGLDHISVLHNDPLCQAAILLDSTPGINKSALPALFRNGSNSQSCYGTFALPDRSDNVMGRGTQFAAVNAQPWRDRIAVHTMTKAADWQVSLTKVSPRKV